jgi:hypothetical protein
MLTKSRLLASLLAIFIELNASAAFSSSEQTRVIGIPLRSREQLSRTRVWGLPSEQRESESSDNSRRNVLATWASSAIASIVLWNHFDSPAYAAYGDSSNIELPSYIDFLIEKNKTVDPATFLYKGADREVQLERIYAALSRIKTIPAITRDRKWSQVQGVLTGPLGTLIQTMNQVSGSSKDALKAAAKVKADLLAIGQAAAKKSEEGCITAAEAALQDLEAFAKVAF